MKEDKNISGRRKKINETLKGISASKKISKVYYVLILLLYLTANYFTISTTRSEGFVNVFGNPVPLQNFTGIYSSLSSVCVFFLVILFRRLGFFTSLFLIFANLPMQIMSFFVRQSYNSLTGLFTTSVTLLAISIIFFNNRRIGKYQEKMREIAVTDTLTGLPNRYAVTVYMEDLIKKNYKFTLVSVNLNNFKNINDTLGHKAGDEMLIEIANRWRNLADSGKTGTVDFVARLGSDEYALILRGYVENEDIVKAIEAYEAELERKIMIHNCDFFMTARFGYAEFPKDAPDAGVLLSCADAALHEVKKNGGTNKVLRFTPELLKTEHYLAIERRLRVALENDQIITYLQPQYDMAHKLVGFEALARLQDEDGKFISPADFIPVAENAGLIDKVDIAVLRKAANFLADINKEGYKNIRISSNISVRHLMKNDFIEEIKNLIDGMGVKPEDFKMEITESIMIDSDEKALKRIEDIKALGMQVAIDDFGTGYSSLSYLHKFPANLLKIDKSFIDVMNTNDSSKKYVATIISIGHILNLEVISEGVETPDQIETLEEIGCDYIQGYIWGKPMPVDDAVKLVNA